VIGPTGCTIVIEPGRAIMGNVGIMVTRALYLKENDQKKFVIVDAGMNDLLRPSLYDAYHRIDPVVKNRRAEVLADIVGPICESGDFLARERSLPAVKQDELLAVRSAGAYAFAMSSNYNSRPRAAEVLVKGDRFHVVRKRETYADLIADDRMPAFLKSRKSRA